MFKEISGGVNSNGLWNPRSNENDLGGHAMTVIGYDDYKFGGAFKLVKPGGQLVIKDMNDRPIFHALMNRIHDLIFARESINYFNFKEKKDRY